MSTTEVKADPLRRLTMVDVEKRTGYSRRTILRYLTDDTTEKTPGKRFPVPMHNPATGKMEWRETTLVRWFEKREQQS